METERESEVGKVESIALDDIVTATVEIGLAATLGEG